MSVAVTRTARPLVTAIAQPTRAIGRTAARTLLARRAANPSTCGCCTAISSSELRPPGVARRVAGDVLCLGIAAIHVNVGTGTEVTIPEIPETVAHVVGYEVSTEWDTSKPDGTPQELLGVSKLAGTGWTAPIGLEEGLRCTLGWHQEHVAW